jgi:hypothetical protein
MVMQWDLTWVVQEDGAVVNWGRLARDNRWVVEVNGHQGGVGMLLLEVKARRGGCGCIRFFEILDQRRVVDKRRMGVQSFPLRIASHDRSGGRGILLLVVILLMTRSISAGGGRVAIIIIPGILSHQGLEENGKTRPRPYILVRSQCDSLRFRCRPSFSTKQ